METTNQIAVPVSGVEGVQRIHGNRLHIHVNVQGNELELTDERADSNTASVDLHALISAFVGIMKTSGNTNTAENARAITRQIAQNFDNHGVIAKDQGFEAEIVQLRQHNQKLESELMKIRQLLQKSKQENGELKIRFQNATHMKAADIAKHFSQTNNERGVRDCHEFEALTDSEEPYSPEYVKGKLSLNPQIKAIDFCSLDDILGDDNTVDNSPQKIARGSAGRDDGVSVEVSDLGDTKNNPDELLVNIFELSKAAPPSVLKVGLDVDLAKAGGACMVGDSHESPLQRSFHRRGRYDHHDLPAERDSATRTDEDLVGYNDRSMVSAYGIRYKPLPDNSRYYKTVLIGNLPQDIIYQKLLAKVRGGAIISATLCDTTKFRGFGGCMSALVVFVTADSAIAYVQFANKHGIYFDSTRAVVKHVNTPTYPLSGPAEIRMGYGQTRYLVIPKFRSELSLANIDRVINVGVNGYRVDAIERFWKDEDGNVRIRFASINAASMAFWRLSSDSSYNQLKIRFEKDPCGRPLSDLVPSPIGRRFCDYIDTKINYDDKRDSEDEGSEDLKPINSRPGTTVNNADEIELNSEEDTTVGDKSTERKTASDQTINEDPKVGLKTTITDEAKMRHERPIFDYSKKEVEVKETDTILVADEKSPQSENSREKQDSKNLNSSEDQKSNSTSAVSKLESWADDVNEAVEAGTLPALVKLEAKLEANAPTSVLIDFNEEVISPNERHLSVIIEEDLATCEPVQATPAPATLKQAPIVELSPTEHAITTAKTAEDPTLTTFPEKQATISPLPSKYDLTGTNIDPVLLPRFVLDQVLSQKPRAGLLSSRWADPSTSSGGRAVTPTIHVPVPLTVPLLSDAEKASAELLFGITGTNTTPTSSTPPLIKNSHEKSNSNSSESSSSTASAPAPSSPPTTLAPLNAPKGGSGSGSGSGSSDTTHPSCTANQQRRLQDIGRNASAPSRYAGLCADISSGCRQQPQQQQKQQQQQPRASLRAFYKDIDAIANRSCSSGCGGDGGGSGGGGVRTVRVAGGGGVGGVGVGTGAESATAGVGGSKGVLDRCA